MRLSSRRRRKGWCLGTRDVAHRLRGERTTAVWSPHASHKIWKKQCEATRTIGRRFGLKNALDYLVREKLLNFAEAAEQHAEFAAELPRFLADVWGVFHPYELAGYLASLRPMTRKKLQKLLYVRGAARVAG
jgi:hypothetical protein